MFKVAVILCLGFLMLFSCKNEPNYLEEALIFSGNNRPEMEKVLKHYSLNPADSLKLKAAEFLIINMPGHYSYKNGKWLELYYSEIDTSVSIHNDGVTNKNNIELISNKYAGDNVKEVIWDIQVLTAEYLLDNIEHAFEVWEQGEWSTHVSFTDFCEYILPYKGAELQTLDNWREYSKEMFKADLDTMHLCDLYKNSAFWASTTISKEIIKLNQQPLPIGGINSIPVQKIKTLAKIPLGTCSDYSLLALAVMRSKGIPIMEDFTPQWSFQPQSHSWNIVLINNGKNMIFSAGSSNPGELHKPDEKMAKVFRKCYAINRDILTIHSSEEHIPSTFNNYFIKDVIAVPLKSQNVL